MHQSIKRRVGSVWSQNTGGGEGERQQTGQPVRHQAEHDIWHIIKTHDSLLSKTRFPSFVLKSRSEQLARSRISFLEWQHQRGGYILSWLLRGNFFVQKQDKLLRPYISREPGFSGNLIWAMPILCGFGREMSKGHLLILPLATMSMSSFPLDSPKLPLFSWTS